MLRHIHNVSTLILNNVSIFKQFRVFVATVYAIAEQAADILKAEIALY